MSLVCFFGFFGVFSIDFIGIGIYLVVKLRCLGLNVFIRVEQILGVKGRMFCRYVQREWCLWVSDGWFWSEEFSDYSELFQVLVGYKEGVFAGGINIIFVRCIRCYVRCFGCFLKDMLVMRLCVILEIRKRIVYELK